ncbi:MAG: cytochrome c biogenesis protein CcsA [Gammaproteobacteria bacterium]|nr:cytochrome c biogenesis protein CcsA [Gammaproteobacteria bacterium]
MKRLRLHWPWLSIAVVVALALTGRHPIEYTLLIVAMLTGVIALADSPKRWVLARLLAGLLLGLCAALVLHLWLDHFDYRYAWLYSAPALPGYLKFSLLWGGEEGTLLITATLCSLLAVHLCRYRGWAGAGALLLTLVFVGGTLLWNPFAETPAHLAGAPPRGMNAHLTSVWMVAHPPLILLAYALLLAPAGAALQMQTTGRGDWMRIAERYTRCGWLILSAGLGIGMWWAFQDFTFGAFWHWDPVQTSVFMVWALATAQLHGLARAPRAGDGRSGLPVLALATATSVSLAMLITRNTMLASSHRYVGDTSYHLFSGLSIVLGLLTAIGLWFAVRHRIPQDGKSRLMLSFAVALFTAIALLAGFAIAHAFANELLGVERAAADKPFLGTLLRWTSGVTATSTVQQAFAQWTVDGFWLNRFLAPLAGAIGLVGGHAFLQGMPRTWRWCCSGGVLVFALAIAALVDPFDHWFLGRGMTSQRTVEIFFWLNLSLITAAYLGFASLWWALRVFRAPRDTRAIVRRLAVGAIHAGAMLAFSGAMSASVLDAYVQRTLQYPGDFEKAHVLPDGYTLQLSFAQSTLRDDGARSSDRTAFSAVVDVSLGIRRGESEWEVSGNTLYRDDRIPVEESIGPVRQLCQILDYRYARFAAADSYMLDPFIYRGLLADVQVWVAPLHFTVTDAGPMPRSSEVTVVIHRYPLLSLLWLGLALALTGGGLHTFLGWRHSGKT